MLEISLVFQRLIRRGVREVIVNNWLFFGQIEGAEAKHAAIVVVFGEEPGQGVFALRLLIEGLNQIFIFDILQIDFNEVVLFRDRSRVDAFLTDIVFIFFRNFLLLLWLLFFPEFSFARWF